jgi:ketosteroid isomerase-like protein
VRFQFSEIVEHADADLVLRTLEYCFRDISLEVIHTEDQLTICGLGPSFRTMNRNDRTILRATRQQTATIIHAEANFLASALVGDIPQDTIVRSKIEQALRCMKTQLNLDAVPISEDPLRSPLDEPLRPLHTQSSTRLVPEPPVPLSPEPLALEQAPFESATPEIATEPIAQPPMMESDEAIGMEPKGTVAAINTISTATAPTWPTRLTFNPDTDTSAPTPSQAFVPMTVSPAEHKRSAVLPLTLLAILLALCTTYLLQHRDLTGNLFTRLSATLNTPVADKPAATQASPTPEHGAGAHPTPSSAKSGQSTTFAGPEDIKVWIEEWSAAMRTRDPEAQVSFYADPVDRYFLTPGVSKKELLRDKQSEIESRNGLWAFKAEDVVIQRRTGSNAIVLLTKHIVVKPPSSSIREQHIKTQLKLKLIDGNWKITSERTLGWG